MAEKSEPNKNNNNNKGWNVTSILFFLNLIEVATQKCRLGVIFSSLFPRRGWVPVLMENYAK